MSIVDVLMLIAFLGFMVFIFGGYHKTKFEQRQGQDKKDKNF